MTLKLYTAERSRGIFTEWYLKELGLDKAEVINLDNKEKKEQQSESYRKINPFQRVPFLIDGDLRLAESGAIQLYLAEKYGNLKTTEDRAIAAKWTFFGQTTLSEVLFQPGLKHQQANTLKVLNDALESSEYLMGAFGAADVAVAAVLSYAQMMLGSEAEFNEYPAIKKFLERIRARPHFKPVLAALSKG